MGTDNLVVLATDSPDPSGVGKVMLNLAGVLRTNWSVRLLFPDHAAGRDLKDEAVRTGLSAATVAADGWYSAFVQAALVNIHAGIGWEGHDLCAAARTAGAAVIRTEHLPWLITDREQMERYAAKIANVDAVIAVSQSSARSWRPVLAAMCGGRVPLTSIPNGIAPATVPTPPPAGQTILCVARFTRQKNHRTLISAMARLRASHPRAVLRLVGSGPEEAAIRVRVARLKLTNIEFLGQRKDVPALMADAAIVVLASGFEGLPLVVLEAMAAGRPVVATRIGGVTDALGDRHPWLVRAGDARALAAALADALDRPAARARVAAAQSARFGAYFTDARMGADTARLYRTILRSKEEGRDNDHPSGVYRCGRYRPATSCSAGTDGGCANSRGGRP